MRDLQWVGGEGEVDGSVPDLHFLKLQLLFPPLPCGHGHGGLALSTSANELCHNTTALQYFEYQCTCRCGKCFQSASHSSVTFGIIFGARLHPSSRQRSPADTRRTTIPTNCTGGFEENPWLHVETNINKVPQKWIITHKTT